MKAESDGHVGTQKAYPSSIIEEDVRTIVELVGTEVRRLAGKSLLITGGTGFVGSYLLETVAYLNDQVLDEPCRLSVMTRDAGRVATRFPHLHGRPDLTVIEADVRTFRPRPASWNFVIHAAAPSDVRVFIRDPVETVDTIVEGTKRVLSVAAEAGVEAFLFVSSGAVYGHQRSDLLWLSEEYAGGPDLLDSRSCYAEAKRCGELLCRIFQDSRKVPITIARPFSLLGPYQNVNSTSAVVDFIRQAMNGDTIRIRDAGETVRSYCYLADAVTALWKLVLGPQRGEAFNVGSDLEAVSFRELAGRIGKCLGKPITVVVEGAPAAGVLGKRYAPDVARLHRATGFRPATTLDEALRRTIAWMQRQ